MGVFNGFFNRYPYTDFHELNLDWVLTLCEDIDTKFKTLEEQIAVLREDLTIQEGRIDACLEAINYIQENYRQMIAPEYDPNHEYDIDDIVRYSDSIYIAGQGVTPGEWTGEHWTRTTIAEILGPAIYKIEQVIIPDLQNLNNIFAEYGRKFEEVCPTWVQGDIYQKGDMVFFNDKIYISTVDNNTEEPGPVPEWDETTFSGEVGLERVRMDDLISELFSEWDDTARYYSGDIVYERGVNNNIKIYECVAGYAGTGPGWLPADWHEVIFSDLVKNSIQGYDWNMTVNAGDTTEIIVVPTNLQEYLVDAYASIYGISPDSITVEAVVPGQDATKITVVWPAQSVDFDFVIRLTKNKDNL